jgi:hypothetical protein
MMDAHNDGWKLICDGWRQLADDRGAERAAVALELERSRLEAAETVRAMRAQLEAAWTDNRALRSELDRLSLDAHIMAEELERERAPKRDCR